MRIVLILILFVSIVAQSQEILESPQAGHSQDGYERGQLEVNKCTPWHHMKCVFITTSEVYKDGTEGKPTRHWWRMSYIGQACTNQHGPIMGKIFEGFFAVPHYLGVAMANGTGYLVYKIRKH